MQARRHVNRLCLAAGVPLVESGTAGYLGQVGLPAALCSFWQLVLTARMEPAAPSTAVGHNDAHTHLITPRRGALLSLLAQVSVHVRGATECFECAPKPAPKSYPVCTIRNTPDKPIHCVVWAKDLLFPRLFGSPGAATDLDGGSGWRAGWLGLWEEALSAQRVLGGGWNPASSLYLQAWLPLLLLTQRAPLS